MHSVAIETVSPQILWWLKVCDPLKCSLEVLKLNKENPIKDMTQNSILSNLFIEENNVIFITFLCKNIENSKELTKFQVPLYYRSKNHLSI